MTALEVRVGGQFFAGSIAVMAVLKHDDGTRQVLHVDGDGVQHWDNAPPAAAIEPTWTMDDEIARALLDALTRHYQGASDMHTVRADLLHERQRVDKLTDAVIRIATEVPGGTHA